MSQQGKVRFDEYIRGELSLTLAFAVFAAMSLSLVVGLSIPKEPGARTSASSEEAGSAVFAAAKSEDENAPVAILGLAVLLRRIGKNELSAIDARHQLVDEEQYHTPWYPAEYGSCDVMVSIVNQSGVLSENTSVHAVRVHCGLRTK